MPVTREVTIHNELGLHARPAARFVEAARGYQADVQLRAAGRSGSAKSLIGVLALGVSKGTTVEITADGPDAEEALDGLLALLDELEREHSQEVT